MFKNVNKKFLIFSKSCFKGTAKESDYFSRLKKLGDFELATRRLTDTGAYHNFYLDFGISMINGKFYFVIGKI